MIETILTKHPQGKKGRSISRAKYEVMRKAVTSVLRKKPLSHEELLDAVYASLEGEFEGSIGWYMETVKLDLEANKVIDRTGAKPQRYKLTK